MIMFKETLQSNYLMILRITVGIDGMIRIATLLWLPNTKISLILANKYSIVTEEGLIGTCQVIMGFVQKIISTIHFHLECGQISMKRLNPSLNLNQRRKAMMSMMKRKVRMIIKCKKLSDLKFTKSERMCLLI